LRAGDDVQAAMAGGAAMISNAGFAMDYFEVRHAETLAPVASNAERPLRILVAARIGKTRLIDNMAV
jgi:pantoate--beta-alanine ligase